MNSLKNRKQNNKEYEEYQRLTQSIKAGVLTNPINHQPPDPLALRKYGCRHTGISSSRSPHCGRFGYQTDNRRRTEFHQAARLDGRQSAINLQAEREKRIFQVSKEEDGRKDLLVSKKRGFFFRPDLDLETPTFLRRKAD